MKPRRLVAALLGILLLFQCLPLTMPSPADLRSGAKIEAKSFFEPLRVCEHGESLTAYFSDHPWLSSATSFFCTSVSVGSFPDAVKVGLSKGFPPSIYKPPRTARS